MRILLVEDDKMIGESLKKALGYSRYTVDWARDASTAEEAVLANSYDILLLDIGLPQKSGIDILKELRKNKNMIPVLILTARDSLSDKVIGLDAGADDYLIKPFELEELEARIRALLRRKSGHAETLIEYGNIILNPSAKTIMVKGVPINLAAREYALIYALMKKPGAILSVTELEDCLYGWNEEVESNAVEVHIYQLRKKLGKSCIVNVRGMGYKIGKI